ncbi:hypothetical protein [Janthinobacterium sp. GW458P]|uniref:hypothetical protein n=1 Tax=Janthinobacterium sp. GW458P TaxID=1981504 RepID=UPI00112411AA|nr:hypothetical protein [Janthinobacterium sp. GW458P]MBE3025707.1 hypothetical protein [Janthinobacterium sp. GW458P]
MTEFALIIREPGTQRIKFDSRLAVGGVCLGLYNVPTGGRFFSFPTMGPGLSGIVVRPSGNAMSDGGYRYEGSLYPIFIFQFGIDEPVALFVK